MGIPLQVKWLLNISYAPQITRGLQSHLISTIQFFIGHYFFSLQMHPGTRSTCTKMRDPMISLIDNNTFKETKYLRVSKMGQWEPRKSSPDQWKSRIQSLSVNYRISIFHFPEAGRRDYDVPISVAIHTSDLDDDVQESRHGLNNLCMHRCELTIYIFDIL